MQQRFINVQFASYVVQHIDEGVGERNQRHSEILFHAFHSMKGPQTVQNIQTYNIYIVMYAVVCK